MILLVYFQVRCYHITFASYNESEEEFTAGARSAVERIKGLTEVRKAANEVDICVMECMLCQKVTVKYFDISTFSDSIEITSEGKSKQFR